MVELLAKPSDELLARMAAGSGGKGWPMSLPMTDDLGLTDVALRGAEGLVADAALDLEGLVTTDGAPGDADGAEVVEGQGARVASSAKNSARVMPARGRKRRRQSARSSARGTFATGRVEAFGAGICDHHGGHVARGDLAAGTAESVARTMAVAARELRRVVIQGAGGVGRLLAGRLSREGVNVAVFDILPVEGLPDGVIMVAPAHVYDEPADVFAPCAIGGVLDAGTITRLKCRVVCGAANNPLAGLEDADRLQARGINYVPDVLANAGATIVGASHALGEEHRIADRLDALVALTGDVLS